MIFLPDDSWEVKQSGEKGRGIYTMSDITPGTIIGDYLGTIIHPVTIPSDTPNKHFYAMYYHDTAAIIPDLTIPDLYLINHACAPNCWVYTYKGHTLFFTLRHIFAGEELTISYLLSPQDIFCNPCTHTCQCDGVICFQTMHLSEKRFTQWTKVHDEISKQTKKERIRYGKSLAPLTEYPKTILDHTIYTLFGKRNSNPTIIEANAFPPKSVLRQILRESGVPVRLEPMGITVLGVMEDLLILG